MTESRKPVYGFPAETEAEALRRKHQWTTLTYTYYTKDLGLEQSAPETPSCQASEAPQADVRPRGHSDP
jgi:hypothetical protein